jgi:capsular polysaccharide export protein
LSWGTAIYNLPGLTFQGTLDDFWQAQTPPDERLYDALRRVLAARSMICGGFFSETGLQLAVNAAVAEPAALIKTELAEISL